MGVALQIDQRIEIEGQSQGQLQQCTLLELVSAVADITSNEDEIVATVLHLLRSGQVQLCGNFRGAPPDSFTP